MTKEKKKESKIIYFLSDSIQLEDTLHGIYLLARIYMPTCMRACVCTHVRINIIIN